MVIKFDIVPSGSDEDFLMRIYTSPKHSLGIWFSRVIFDKRTITLVNRHNKVVGIFP